MRKVQGKKSEKKLKTNVKIVILLLIAVAVVSLCYKITDDKYQSEKLAEQKQAEKKKQQEAAKKKAAAQAALDPTVKKAKKKANADYFSDACFIGNSRSEGLKEFGPLTTATYFTASGLNVTSATTDANIMIGGNLYTVVDALKQVKFKKVYIMLGTNEIGWPYPDVFIQKYQEIIETIKSTQPGATIYVESILPVGNLESIKATAGEALNNNNIKTMNQRLLQMAKDEKVRYLDLNSYFTEKDGYLSLQYSSDGIHVNTEGANKWAEYLEWYYVK